MKNLLLIEIIAVSFCLACSELLQLCKKFFYLLNRHTTLLLQCSLLVLGIFLLNTVYAKSFLSNEKQNKSAFNSLIQLNNLPLDSKIIEQKEYHPAIVLEVLDNLKKKKNDQAFLLLQTIQVPKKVQKDNIYALYLYLLTYFYFLQNDFENTLNKSNEYLTYFPQHKEVYQMFYYNLYASHKLKSNFVFETDLKLDFFKNFKPTSLVKPFKELIIDYSKIKTKSKLIRFLSKKKDKKLLLTSIPKIYSIEFLSNLEKTFLSSEISEKAFLRKIELISLQQNQENKKKNISLIIKQSQGHNSKTLKKAENLSKNIIKKKKKILKIGVLLPYSIQSPKIKDIVSDIQTSINIFFQNKNTRYEFIFENTALRPDIAAKSFKKLVDKDVIAVIGPLSRLNSRALREKTSNYKTPLFSLTTEEFLGKDYPYFYRYQRNSFRENEILVRYSRGYLNAKKFVAFYDSEESYKKVLHFSKEVEKSGGKMIAIEKIESDSISSLRNIFRKITGNYRYLNNSEEKIFQEIAEKKTESGIDAFYLPISPLKIRLISSFFSSYNLKNAYILTNGTFRTHQLNLLALNNFYFVDNFSFSQKNPLYADYLNYYKITQAKKKASIYAIATTKLLNSLDQLIFTFNIRSAKDLKRYLDLAESVDFLAGELEIDINGEISSPYTIYKLKNKKIVPVL